MVYYCWVDSPVGPLLVAGDENGLQELGFSTNQKRDAPQPGWQKNRLKLQDTISQIESYFSGKLKMFSLNLAMTGSPFQLKVWRALQEIPYGTTISYGQLARKIGKPKASRAVGTACAKNPISIVTPCHRVIGSTGKLTGFGGGLVVKQALLALERHYV